MSFMLLTKKALLQENFKLLQTSQKNNYNWHYFQNTDRRRELHDRYKLHVSVDPKVFPEVEDQVHTILNRAIKKGSIITYKTYDVMRNHKEDLSPEALRQQNNPFVIYLNDEQATNPQYLSEITQVCKEIENVLYHSKAGEHRATSDLPLTPHIIFRQAILDGDVNPVKGKVPYKPAQGNDAETLKEQGKGSITYQLLTENLHDFRPMEELVSSYKPPEKSTDQTEEPPNPGKPWVPLDAFPTQEKPEALMSEPHKSWVPRDGFPKQKPAFPTDKLEEVRLEPEKPWVPLDAFNEEVTERPSQGSKARLLELKNSRPGRQPSVASEPQSSDELSNSPHLSKQTLQAIKKVTTQEDPLEQIKEKPSISFHFKHE
ncbi:hypothetical protein [Legionella sp. WA2024007413]